MTPGLTLTEEERDEIINIVVAYLAAARTGIGHVQARDAFDNVIYTMRKRLSSPQGETWRPISEAPKDGTRILLWAKRYEKHAGRDTCDARQIGYWEPVGPDNGMWLIRRNIYIDPTHWMPLPAAPSPTAHKEEK